MFELRHWEYLHDFSAEELAALMIGIDPRDLGKTTSWQTIDPSLRRVQADYEQACESAKMIFVMFGKEEIESHLETNFSGLISVDLKNVIDNYSWMEDSKFVIDWINSDAAHVGSQRFSRKAISEWMEKECLNSSFPFAKEKNAENNNQKFGLSSPVVTKWPWGDHTTKDLEHLEAAGNKFWKLYDPADPSTAPTIDQVKDWLNQERGVPKERAYYIASILRADGLPDGRRR